MKRAVPVVAGLLLLTTAAEARVTRIEILRTEPFAAGQAFGNVGPYEKVVGRFHGELDPAAPLNAIIVDLDKAPRNAARSNIPPTSTSCGRPISPRATAPCSMTSTTAATSARSSNSTARRPATTRARRRRPATDS
jgi:hypothetical protein